MALTQISTDGIKNGTITGSDLATNIDLVDNQKLRIGTSNDLLIWHGVDGSENSYIIQQTSKHLIIKADSALQLRADTLNLWNHAQSKRYIACSNNSSVDLYFNNGKKFETTSTGATVTGSLIADGLKVGDNESIRAGGSSDMQMFHDATGATHGTAGVSYIKVQGTHDNIFDIFTASATGKISLKSNNLAETMLSATGNGAVELYHDNSKKFETTSTGATISGNLNFGDSNIAIFGNSNDFQVYHDGTNSRIENSTGALILKNQAQDGDVLIQGNDGGTNVNLLSFDTSETGMATLNGELNMRGTHRIKFNYNTGNGSFQSFIGQRFINNSFNMVIDNQQNNIFYQANQHVFRDKVGEGGEVHATMITNGAVELYHDNSKKFETTNNGAEITGRLEIDRGSAVEQAIDINTTGTTSASRIRFLESGTLKAQIAYSHGGDQIEVVGNAGQKAAFFTNGNQRLFIDTSGNIGFNRTNTNAGDSQTQAQVSTPNRVVFNNQYSNGFTDASLKVYLFNDGSTRQGFTSGPEYDVQYHSSGHSTLTKHSFYTANTERLRINSDTNGRYLGRTPLNPAESAEEIKNDVSGTPDNDWYYIKQFGNVARLHYCVFKDKNGSDIAGGPWTMNWVAGVHPNQFSTNGSTALGQYLNLCKGIGIDKPGRGMESSRTTSQVYGAWLAVKRALWDLDPGFFNGASSSGGGVLTMPIMNINGEGGSSDHRLVYSTGTSTHIPPNQDGDHCNQNQLFCGWWGGNDFSSWATDNNSVPSPEDWGPGDAPHTGDIGAKSNSTTQKPSWKDMMLITCIYK